MLENFKGLIYKLRPTARWYNLVLSLISMADQHLSTTAKKSKEKGIVKVFRDIIKPKVRPKDSASLLNSTRVSVPAFAAHDPVSGNDAGSVEIDSSKYIDSILV